MRISVCLFLLSLISLLSFVSAQAVYNPGDIYALNNQNNDTQTGDEGSSFLRMAAKGESSATTDATSTTSGKDSAAATTTETTKKGHGTSLFASPEILTNGTLFYIALSVTCLLWATGRFIDFKTDRLERFTETNVHKL